MDFTDGSKEAKLMQELLHLIEEAIFSRNGEAVGFMSEVIMKELKQKGLSNDDFCFVSVHSQFSKEYEVALTKERIPCLFTKDIYGNSIVIVQSSNKERLLDVDAKIKKGSSEYSRSEYIKSFIENNRILGRETFSVPIRDEGVFSVLAAKAFDHESGFVASYHDGICYFDETASRSEIGTIFLDLATTTMKDTAIGRVKELNTRHEGVNESSVYHAMAKSAEKGTADTIRYYANEFNNKDKYLKIENGILEVHEFNGRIDTVTTQYDYRDFKDNSEGLRDIVERELSKIHDCKDMKESEHQAYVAKTRDELSRDREEALFLQAKAIAGCWDESAPRAANDPKLGYISTDRKSLFKMRDIIGEKIKAASPEEKQQLKTIKRNLGNFIASKLAQDNLREYVQSEIRTRRAQNLNYKSLSDAEKIEWQFKTIKHILAKEDSKVVSDFLATIYGKGNSMAREELVASFEQYADNIKPVSETERRALGQVEQRPFQFDGYPDLK